MSTVQDVTGQLASGGRFRATPDTLEFFDAAGSSQAVFDTGSFTTVRREGNTVVVSRHGDTEITAEAATSEDAGRLEAFLINLSSSPSQSAPAQEETKKGSGLRRFGCIGGIIALVLLVGCVAIIALVAVGGDDDEDDTANQATEITSEDPTEASEEDEVEPATEPDNSDTDESEPTDEPDQGNDSDSGVTAPEPVSFRGTGDSLTDPVDLQEGILILEASHDGESNFIVEIVSTESAESSLSINEIGNYGGTRGHPVQSDPIIGVATGEHRLQIQADGNWSIDVTQPVWDSGDALPVDYSGIGDAVVGPVELNAGTIPFSLTHNGGSNFIVQVVGVDGSSSELVVNEIGTYQGSPGLAVQESAPLGLGLESGLHVIIIEADGNWSMELGE